MPGRHWWWPVLENRGWRRCGQYQCPTDSPAQEARRCRVVRGTARRVEPALPYPCPLRSVALPAGVSPRTDNLAQIPSLVVSSEPIRSATNCFTYGRTDDEHANRPDHRSDPRPRRGGRWCARRDGQLQPCADSSADQIVRKWVLTCDD